MGFVFHRRQVAKPLEREGFGPSGTRPRAWPRGQPRMVTASVRRRRGPLADTREQERSRPPARRCDGKRSLKWTTAAPVLRAVAFLPLSQGGPAPGKESGPSQTMLIVIILACGILVP